MMRHKHHVRSVDQTTSIRSVAFAQLLRVADNNNENCGYDGGDCCGCDCVSSALFVCGESETDCLNPASTCFGLGEEGRVDGIGSG